MRVKRLRIWIAALSALSCSNLFAVVQNGILNFDPVPGAIRYTLWRALPGRTQPDYLASFPAPPFQVPGPTPDFSTFYVRTVAMNDDGSCCKESDLGFVVTPPTSTGTNVLRFIGPVSALRLQSAGSAAGPWLDLALYTNSVIPLAPRTNQFLRTLLTNLPPPFP